jgi:hypothetical protein
MSTAAERLNRREQNRSSCHFHSRRTPEQKGREQKQLPFPLAKDAPTEHNRTESISVSNGEESGKKQNRTEAAFSFQWFGTPEQDGSSFSMSTH